MLDNNALVDKMRSSKASYAGYLADVIAKNPNGKAIESLVPRAVIEAFNKLKEWE